MSKVALSGNASGTGTFTIASPNSNTDRTLDLPDASGTILTTATPGVPVNGPAFSAYNASSQTGIANNTYTKILFPTEEFDTNTNYDASTARFTPTIAGYYQVNAAVTANSLDPVNRVVSAIYKNGVIYREGGTAASNGAVYATSGVSVLVYLNGSTDYVEVYAYGAQGATWSTIGRIDFNYFQAFLARSAT